MTAALAVLGGLLALDQTSLGQFMLARPLVSASLAGWILGDPAAGLAAGALLEILFLPSFPVGGARFPEGGPAGVVAAVAAVEGADAATGAGLALGVGLGAVWSVAGGWSVTLLRRVNERLVLAPGGGPVGARRVVAGHVSALACDFVRGVILTAVGIAAARLLSPLASGAWPLDTGDTVLVLAVVGGLSVGGLVAALDGWRRRRGVLLGGLALGAVVGWLL